MPTLGENIRARRDHAGLNQDELAAIIGVEKRQIGRWENDKQEPSLANLRLLARAFGTPIGELVGETPTGPDLSGRWFAAWETTRGGVPFVDCHELEARHNGEFLRLDATGSYRWRGELHVFDADLVGHYVAIEAGQSSRGGLAFTLHDDGRAASGGWVGRYVDGISGSGRGALARTEAPTRQLLAELMREPGPLTALPTIQEV